MAEQTRGETQRPPSGRQRSRSLAIAVALGVLVALFYAATIVRMGGQMSKPAAPAAFTVAPASGSAAK